MANRIIEKVLAGEEDLLFGQGQVDQIRNDIAIAITKINASVIPYSGDVNDGNLVSVVDQLNILLGYLTNTKHLPTTIQGGSTAERYHLTLAEKNSIGGIGTIPDHNDTLNIQGGTAADRQHLTIADVSKLAGIESGATADQTKADIDALNINAAYIDGYPLTNLQKSIGTGSDSDITNLDNIVDRGVTGSINCTTGTPDGSANTWWNLINVRHLGGSGDGTNYGMQIVAAMNNGDTNTLLWRNQNSTTWSDWHKIYGQDSDIIQSQYNHLTGQDISGAVILDRTEGDMQSVTALGNLTISFAGFPASKFSSFRIYAANWGSYTITWPAGTIFDKGIAPIFTTGTDSILITRKRDNAYSVYLCASDMKA